MKIDTAGKVNAWIRIGRFVTRIWIAASFTNNISEWPKDIIPLLKSINWFRILWNSSASCVWDDITKDERLREVSYM